MSTRGRRWLLAALALAVVAVVALGIAACLAFGDGSLEAAGRRVSLGTDEEAVARAVGRPPDGLNHKPARGSLVDHRVLYWRYGNSHVLVEFVR
jgi:hypothetical protein